MAEYTEEQLAEMRAAVAADDARRAQEARDKRDAYIKPVRDLIDGPEYAAVLTGLRDIKAHYADDDFLSVHVNALAEIMPRLVDVVGYSYGVSGTATAPAVAPAPAAEQSEG